MTLFWANFSKRLALFVSTFLAALQAAEGYETLDLLRFKKSHIVLMVAPPTLVYLTTTV